MSSFRFCVILFLKDKPRNFSSFRLCIVPSQRSLGSILLPPPSVRYTRMRKEQEATFAKRESDQIAVGWVIWCFECPVSHFQMIEGTYPPVSIFYWVRSLFSIALSLLLILVGFVLWPVHDVLKDESYWWT